MAQTLIVETVTGRTMAEIRAARDAATGDLVEVRLDGVRDLDVAGVLHGRRRPVIVTCRPRWEGGEYDDDEATRLGWLADAVSLGAEYVDVEMAADAAQVPRGEKTRRIVSTHEFAGFPADIAARVRRMRAAGADVVKVAVPANALRDCVSLREAMRNAGPHVAIGMGPAGVITRVCPWLFGSAMTYAGSAAPGQLPVRVLAEIYRVRETSQATTIFGVAGCPLAHSASPAMHNAAFVETRADAVFVPFETSSAPELLEVAAAFGVAGLSVTAPIKQRLLASGVEGDATVAAIGAANTLKRQPHGWAARNFDAEAFLAPLIARRDDVRDRTALVLGAGGAARAAAWALRHAGARVAVSARRESAAASLARDLGIDTAPWPPSGDWDLVVQATPAGTAPRREESPVTFASLSARLAYDLVYNPPQTAFLRAARAAGAAVIGGLDMLVAQAARQFTWWTGRQAPVEAMARAARAFVDHEREA